MLKLVLVALASTALTTGAFATEAFIGQEGDHHTAQNIQLNQTNNSDSIAVIFQSEVPGGGNGHDALQVQLGDDNYAYTYQKSDYFDHIALTWQDGTDNSAVTVQWTAGDTLCNEPYSGTCSNNTSVDARLKSRIIQNGDSNVAVNWQSSGNGNTGSPTYSLTPATPNLALYSGSYNVSGPNTAASPDYAFGAGAPSQFY